MDIDAANNRLLLAIKDAEPGGENYKGIYAFDLVSKKMQGEPAYKIDLDHSLLQDDKGKKKSSGIMPSAITIHPSTKELFITDGRKSKLLVLDNKGDVKKLYKLDKQSFAQPEGITFTPAGELFISNEGPKQPANILKVEISEQKKIIYRLKRQAKQCLSFFYTLYTKGLFQLLHLTNEKNNHEPCHFI